MSVSKSATRVAATSVRAGDSALRSFAGSAEGSLPTPEAAAFAPAKDFLGPGVAGFIAGGGLLLSGAAGFALPRALLTSRLGSPTLVNARRFRIAS